MRGRSGVVGHRHALQRLEEASGLVVAGARRVDRELFERDVAAPAGAHGHPDRSHGDAAEREGRAKCRGARRITQGPRYVAQLRADALAQREDLGGIDRGSRAQQAIVPRTRDFREVLQQCACAARGEERVDEAGAWFGPR